LKEKIENKESIGLYITEIIHIVVYGFMLFAPLFGIACVIVLPWLTAFYIAGHFGQVSGMITFTITVFFIYILLRKYGVIKDPLLKE